VRTGPSPLKSILSGSILFDRPAAVPASPHRRPGGGNLTDMQWQVWIYGWQAIRSSRAQYSFARPGGRAWRLAPARRAIPQTRTPHQRSFAQKDHRRGARSFAFVWRAFRARMGAAAASAADSAAGRVTFQSVRSLYLQCPLGPRQRPKSGRAGRFGSGHLQAFAPCREKRGRWRKTPTWFAPSEDRPLAFFAEIWTTWRGTRSTKANPVEGEHQLFGFLSTEANAEVRAIHPKAMPVQSRRG
jgi:hypothetical protein